MAGTAVRGRLPWQLAELVEYKQFYFQGFTLRDCYWPGLRLRCGKASEDRRFPGFYPGRRTAVLDSKGVLMTGQRSRNDNDRYVQPNKERGGWDVVKELHKQVSAHTETKEQAINRARQIIKNAGAGELRIKDERCQLIDSNTVR